MVRSLYYWTLVAIYVFVYAIPAILVGFFDRTGKSGAALCRSWARLVLRTVGVEVHLEGVDLEGVEGPRIYMSNHQSYFDVVALMGYLPDNARFVAKKTLEYVPIFGQAMRGVGTVIIDRKKPEKAREILNNIAGDRMEHGIGVIIFPEGTRSRDGRLGEFKKGGFMIALNSGATIVPVGVSGTADILPAGSMRIGRGKNIHIRIGDPIKTEDLTLEDREVLMEKTRRAVEALVGDADKMQYSKGHPFEPWRSIGDGETNREGDAASPSL